MTTEGSRDFCPPAERVATFDNDGTLWSEQPLQTQIFFLIDRVKGLATKDPAIAQRQPFKALLELDKADDYGITLVSMKNDWTSVFV